jgi:polyisoprenoid-binding protein YceI
VARFKVDPGQSVVSTEVRANLHGSEVVARGLRGFIEGELLPDGFPDLGAPHRARLKLPVTALKSGNRLQDIEMERRMDVRRHPAIDVAVKQVKRAARGRYRAKVDVSVKGATRAIEGDLSIKSHPDRVEVDGEHVFDMRDFGISPPRLFLLKVEPEVRVRVHIVARPVPKGDRSR